MTSLDDRQHISDDIEQRRTNYPLDIVNHDYTQFALVTVSECFVEIRNLLPFVVADHGFWRDEFDERIFRIQSDRCSQRSFASTRRAYVCERGITIVYIDLP